MHAFGRKYRFPRRRRDVIVSRFYWSCIWGAILVAGLTIWFCSESSVGWRWTE
jgi:hypothetical protein